MTSDTGEREPEANRPALGLPRVLDVQVHPTIFDPPTLRNFTSTLPHHDQTIEFVVETGGPIPPRALGPVLYVGESAVTEVTAVDETHYTFTALRPEELQEGAPIHIGWSGQPPRERLSTGFRYEPPTPDTQRPQAL